MSKAHFLILLDSVAGKGFYLLLHSFFFNKVLQSVIYLFIYLFIYLWLCWVFVSVRGLSPVAASGGHSSSWCAGLSLSRPLSLWSTGSRRAGSVVVAHGPSCFAACGIFPDQGSNPCPLHWQADSQPLRHQGSPQESLEKKSYPVCQLSRCLKLYKHTWLLTSFFGPIWGVKFIAPRGIHKSTNSLWFLRLLAHSRFSWVITLNYVVKGLVIKRMSTGVWQQ